MAEVGHDGYNIGMEFLGAYTKVAAKMDREKDDLCAQLSKINAENADLSALKNALVDGQERFRQEGGKRFSFAENTEVRELIDKVREQHPELMIPYQYNEASFNSTLRILQEKMEGQVREINKVLTLVNFSFEEGILYTESMREMLRDLQRFIEAVVGKFVAR